MLYLQLFIEYNQSYEKAHLDIATGLPASI